MFAKLLKFRSANCVGSLTRGFATKIKSTEYPDTSDTSLEQTHIDEVVKVAPILKAANIDLWNRSHQVFINHGFKTTNFLRIIAGNPTILSRQPKKIIDCLENWRSCQFGEKNLFLLITKYPTFLDISDGRKLLKQVTFLREYFGSYKNVWKVLMNSPDVIQQPQDVIVDKMEYITKVMRIEIPEIAKSAALSSTLFDIRCRHVFLDRLGLFIPRPPKADPNEPTKNHRLYQITDSSETKFVKKIARVSLMEFNSFQKLFKKELEREERKLNNEDGSDDEDDTDTDEDDYYDDYDKYNEKGVRAK